MSKSKPFTKTNWYKETKEIMSSNTLYFRTPLFSIQWTHMSKTLISSLKQFSFRKYIPSPLCHSVQFSSVCQSWPTLCDQMDYSKPVFPVHHQLPELAQTHVESVMPPNHVILVSSTSPAFTLAQHRGLFQWVNSLHQVAKVLELQLQHSPSSEYSGLISFRMDWLDLLAVQETFKGLLQHHSWNASILWCLVFFIVRLSPPYMTTGKTIALTDGPLLAK